MITSLILCIFGAIYYSPYGFTKQLSSTTKSNVTTWNVINNDVGNSSVGKILIIVTTVIRGYVCAILIIIINVLSKLKLDDHIAKKNKMKGPGHHKKAVVSK